MAWKNVYSIKLWILVSFIIYSIFTASLSLRENEKGGGEQIQ